MQPWFKKTLIGLFGASLAAGAMAARARCGRLRVGHWHGRLLRRIGRRLDLDATQQQKLAALADRLQAQRGTLRGQGCGACASLQTLMAGDRFDRTGAQALLDDKLRTAQASSPGLLEALAEFYDSLTHEQQQRVRDHLQQRHGWMRCHA